MTGLLLFRLQDRLPRCRIGFVPLSVVLALAFAAPVWPAVGDVKLNGLYQALCVLVLFPAIIVLGRHSRGSPSIRRLCRAAGILSYPLYITHYPFVYLYMNWISNGHVASGRAIWVPAALFVFTVVFAFVAYRLWDLPLRRALQRRDGEPRGHL
ncbi:acyltransferase family protein [Sphingomonas sp. I4]